MSFNGMQGATTPQQILAKLWNLARAVLQLSRPGPWHTWQHVRGFRESNILGGDLLSVNEKAS